jgi:CrcB protein
MTWLEVALLGGAGAVLRFRVDAWIQRRNDSDFPLGTLVVNVTGSFGLGLLTGLSITGDELLLLGTATIGSFTTFSTWMLESERLGEEGETRLGVLNVGLSIGAGLGAVGAGWALGALL